MSLMKKKNTKVKGAKVNKKKLYLANPYGFSKQTKNLLPKFIKIFQNLNVEVYEPFERTKH